MYISLKVGKLINPSNFWFFIESLYFPDLQLPDLARLHFLRAEPPEPPAWRLGAAHQTLLEAKDFYDSDDDVFILLNRSIALRHLGPRDSRELTVEALAQLWERELATLEDRNSLAVAALSKAISDSQEVSKSIVELLAPLSYQKKLVGFEYVELEDREMQRSRERHEGAMRPEAVCELCLA